MAAVAQVRGRFAASTTKTWDTFTDQRTGQEVAAGRKVTIFVVSDGDLALETIKVPAERVESALAAIEGLKFGDVVDFSVRSDRYGLSFVDRVLGAGSNAAKG